MPRILPSQVKAQLPDLEQINDTTYKTELDDDIIIVGDDKQKHFQPGVQWLNKLFGSKFSFALKDSGGDVFFENGEVQYNKGNLTAKFFPIRELVKKSTLWEPVADLGEMFEFDIFLAKKPAKRIVEFTAIGKDILVFPQPKLTGEEGYSQAANIPGSLALYHPWKRNNQYKAGKFGHIPAPWIMDSSGNGAWGSWQFDGDIFQLVIPEKFYQKASYPIRIDPQLGRQDPGGSGLVIGVDGIGDLIAGLSVTFTEDGVGNKLVAYLFITGSDGLKTKGNVLVGSGMSPDYLTNAETSEIVPVGTAWNDLNFTGAPEFSSGSKYTLVAWGDAVSKSTVSLAFDVGGSDGWHGGNNYVANWPVPPVGGPDGNYYSIYVDYAAVLAIADAYDDVSVDTESTVNRLGTAMRMVTGEIPPDITFKTISPEIIVSALSPEVDFG